MIKFNLYFFILALFTNCANNYPTQKFDIINTKKLTKNKTMSQREKILFFYQELRLKIKKETRNKKTKKLSKSIKSIEYKHRRIKYNNIIKPLPHKKVIENLIALEQEFKYRCLQNKEYRDKTNKKCLLSVEKYLLFCKEQENNGTISNCLKQNLKK